MLYDSLGEGQTEPGPHIFLGGEEGLEDMIPVIYGNAMAIIRDNEMNLVAAFSQAEV